MVNDISSITANLSNHFNGVNTVSGLLAVPNATTGGFAWIGLLFMEQIIMLMAFLPFGLLSAVFASAFICLVSGMFLVYLQLISWQWLMIFLGQILFGIVYSTWQQQR